MQRALESALSEIVFAPAPPGPEAVDEWLARHEIGGDDAVALKASFDRLLVYRDLVRSTLTDALGLSIPRTIARLGGRFQQDLSRFLRERGPRTHYLRDVTNEFIEFCSPTWQTDEALPGYISDLARHEALEISVAASTGALGAATDEIDLDARLFFSPSLVVERYDYAVHKLPADENDRSEPDRVKTALAVYRDAKHDVRYLELTPLAAAILERLRTGLPLGRAVTGACEAERVSLDQSVIDGTSRLLGDLAERGALVGAHPLSSGSEKSTLEGSNPKEGSS